LRLIPGVSARKRRSPPRTGAKPQKRTRPHSHEDTSSDPSSAPCFSQGKLCRKDKLCAGRVRLGHMTNSLFTLQSTPRQVLPGGVS